MNIYVSDIIIETCVNILIASIAITACQKPFNLEGVDFKVDSRC